MALPRGAVVTALSPCDGADDGLLCAGFELPACVESVADARRRVGRQLRRWAFPREIAHTAQLLVSELTTNAVVHSGGSRVGCLLRAGGNRLRLEVHDDGPSPVWPGPRWAGFDDESGRGLLLVETFAASWGVTATTHGTGRIVWAELDGIAT